MADREVNKNKDLSRFYFRQDLEAGEILREISWSALFSSRSWESSETCNTEAAGCFDDALNQSRSLWSLSIEIQKERFHF